MTIFVVNSGSVEEVYNLWKEKKAVPETAEANAQCALLVQKLTGAPRTECWRRGDPVKGGNFTPGTAIATFRCDGRFDGTSGLCHAAIFVKEVSHGIEVWDQWKNGHLEPRRSGGYKHGRRIMEFKTTADKRSKDYHQSNDGDALYVINA